jgi:hypothetical protein
MTARKGIQWIIGNSRFDTVFSICMIGVTLLAFMMTGLTAWLLSLGRNLS